MQEKGTQNTHTLSQSHGADPGETRLISLFTPDLTKSHSLLMRRPALCSVALCEGSRVK